jgi:hypothetical protein
MIRCRGRNGPFTYASHYTQINRIEGQALAYVEIFSHSPHTRRAPIELDGPPREVIKLLRKIARELETATRAALAPNPKA